MFPAAYFAPRYYAPRYWPKTGEEAEVAAPTGGTLLQGKRKRPPRRRRLEPDERHDPNRDALAVLDFPI